MNSVLEFCANQTSAAQIAAHLRACDSAFVPPLSGRVEIDDYAKKIAENAERLEAWAGKVLVGLVVAYCNDTEGRVAFITSVSVLPACQGRGIASQLVTRCIGHAARLGFTRIELEVDQRNAAAGGLYEKHGFLIDRHSNRPAIMYLAIEKE